MDKELAFVFPGQGSQSVGMASKLAAQYEQVHHCFNQASSVLGYDLWQVVENESEEKLNTTAVTQPAILTLSYACWLIWHNQGGSQPALLAGHSLGEYTALVCAEALSFNDAVELVAKRGEFMQQAVSEKAGAMAAIIGLDDGRVEEICEQSAEGDEFVTPANYNTIGQVVIAGHKAAVDRAINLANDAGAKLAKILKVTVPSHCMLMAPAAIQLTQFLESITISKPKYKIINNVDVEIYKSTAEIKNALIRQLYSPVRWVETILKMHELGIQHIVEIGPGKVLSGLIKRNVRNIKCYPTYDASSLQIALHH